MRNAGMHDIFGPGANVERRVIKDYGEIANITEALKKLGLRVVLTSGAFDLFHEGHARYLEKAKSHGDVLIVGMDDDEKVRYQKGANRPMVEEGARAETLCHSRHVDLVFVKRNDDPHWELIKRGRPDVLIAVEETYTPEERVALKEYCGEVVVLERQAAVSTTARIRNVLVSHADELRGHFEQEVGEIFRRYIERLKGGMA